MIIYTKANHTINQLNFVFSIYIFYINKYPVNILLSEDLQSWVISLFCVRIGK